MKKADGVLLSGVVDLAKENDTADLFIDEFLEWLRGKGRCYGGGINGIDLDANMIEPPNELSNIPPTGKGPAVFF